MTKSAFDKIAEGLEDAIAYAGGDHGRGRVATVDVKALRHSINMTQAEFAAAFSLPIGTVRDWEQGRRSPDAPARALLTIIDRDPGGAGRALAA